MKTALRAHPTGWSTKDCMRTPRWKKKAETASIPRWSALHLSPPGVRKCPIRKDERADNAELVRAVHVRTNGAQEPQGLVQKAGAKDFSEK